MFDPEDIFAKRENAAEAWAQAEYNYSLLDEDKKSVLSKIELKYDDGAKTQAAIERSARADNEYRDYLKGLAAAKQTLIREKTRYHNLSALSDHRQTQEVSNRGFR